MSISKIEQETSITFNSEEDYAILWTCQAHMLRKMEKLGAALNRNDGQGKSFKIPKNWVSIRKPKVMNLTEEQRKVLANRLKSNLR